MPPALFFIIVPNPFLPTLAGILQKISFLLLPITHHPERGFLWDEAHQQCSSSRRCGQGGAMTNSSHHTQEHEVRFVLKSRLPPPFSIHHPPPHTGGSRISFLNFVVVVNKMLFVQDNYCVFQQATILRYLKTCVKYDLQMRLLYPFDLLKLSPCYLIPIRKSQIMFY